MTGDRDTELLTVLTELVRGPALSVERLREHLVARGLSDDDADALLAENPRRLGAYRHLVHNRLVASIRGSLPRTAARRDAIATDIERFVENRGPRTHSMNDIAREFVYWVRPHWQQDPDVPDYLHDLARFEVRLRETRHLAIEPQASAEASPLHIETPVLLDPTACVERFDFAVHRTSDTYVSPVRRETWLLFYRRPSDQTARYYSLTRSQAVFVNMLRDATPLGVALQHAAHADTVGSLAQRLDRLTKLLVALGERGVVRGSMSTPSAR